MTFLKLTLKTIIKYGPCIMTARLRPCLAPLALVALVSPPGCGEETPDFDPIAREVVLHYGALVHATYVDSLASAEAMAAEIDAFLEAPSAAGLEAARAAWIAARAEYTPSEAFRLYGGPIDEVESFINAWPLDEAYIDYVEGAPESGIINDPVAHPVIDAALLRAANEAAGEDSIATGWHAVEFLLWGQDLRDDGPGDRPYTDYVTDGTGTAENQGRRAEYLRVVTAMLIEDLTTVTDAWAPDQDNYRRDFEARPPRDAITDVLRGAASLSGVELAADRLSVAYVSLEQEDEHSCFSDNTHADFMADARGIAAVWSGKRGDLEGPGLSSLVAAFDPALDREVTDAIDAFVAACDAIPAPFDQAILADPGRAKVGAAIEAVRTQTEALVSVADRFEITLNLPSAE